MGAYIIVIFATSFWQAQKLYFWEENMKYSYFKNWLSPALFEVSKYAPKVLAKEVCSCNCPNDTEKAVKMEEIKAPFTVLIAGDSFVNGGVGVELERALIKCASTTVYRASKPSTGLSRRDYFDWRQEIKNLLSEHKPNVVYIMFGANDGQGIPLEGNKAVYYGTPEWDSVYAERVKDFMDILSQANVEVFWIGNPIARSGDYRGKMEKLNEIYSSSSVQYQNIKFISLWDSLKDSNGNYSDYLPNDKGLMQLARESDGIHVTDFGGIITAKELIRQTQAKIPLECMK